MTKKLLHYIYCCVYCIHNFIASLNPRWRWCGRRVLRAASEAAAVRRSVKCGNDEQSQTSVGERQRAHTDLAHSTRDTITSRVKVQSLLSVDKKENEDAMVLIIVTIKQRLCQWCVK